MAQRICPKCNHVENEYTYFCTECGEKTIEYSGSIGTSPMKEKSSHTESDKVSSGVRSPVKSEAGQNLSNKGMIIGLAVTIGLCLITVIAVAASKRNDNHMEVTSTTSFDNDAQQNENIVDAQEEEEPQQDVESMTDNSDEMFSYTESGNEESEIEEEETEEISDDGINSYELVVADVTWTEAFNDCIARGGYLARITTDDEYQAILQQIYSEGKDDIKFWIAGARIDGEDYHWIYEDGSCSEEVINDENKYSEYWLENEPSFYDEATQSYEECMNMFYIKSKGIWVWNDVPDDILEVASFYSGTIGYICEYE